MAKLTAIIVTIIGLVLTSNVSGVYTVPYTDWIIALGVLVIGIAKLIRNYSKKKR